MKQRDAQEAMMSTNQCECIFDPFPYGVIVSDRQGKILQINTAALKLFEVPSASLCRGRPYHQFLHHYEMDDEQHQAISLEPWLKNLIEERSESSAQETITLLQLPSGQKSYVTICSSPMYDAQKHVAETVHVFLDITHRYQKALRLLRVHRAVLKLTEAIGRISEQMDLTFPPETFLLSPPVLAIEQQLVEVVAQVLDCRHTAIWAVGPPAGQLYFAARSGFTAEEEQRRQELSGRYFAREFLDQQALDRLRDSEAVILPAELKPMPPELRTEDRVKQWLMVPLFLEEQLEGGLVIGKADCDGDYTPEEIELVKAVATNTMLVLDCFRCLCGQAQTEGRALAQQEMQRLSDDFLNLASHALNTPLTAIKGNLQVTQRRLAALKGQFAAQTEPVGENIERVQDTLEAAAQGVRLQERMIENLMDDMLIQANNFALHMQHSDLRALLRDAVARKQGSVPQHPIVLEITPSENMVPILADAARITRVINTYLEQALSFSPTDQPVTVRLKVEDTIVRVSVHDAGPAIPVEEQGRIWERFHAATRRAGEQELDAGFGLDLYLSRAFIERHHGHVGVQSASGQGTTFWFSLPLAKGDRS